MNVGKGGELRAALYTLARNLTLGNGTLSGIIDNLTTDRARQGTMFKDGLVAGEPRSLSEVRALLAPPGDPGTLSRLKRIFNLCFNTLSLALNAIKRGKAAGLSNANENTFSAASVGADLLEAERILGRFIEQWPEAAPLDPATPRRLHELAARFQRAADLLSVELDPRHASASVDPNALDRVAERVAESAAEKVVEALGARDDDDAPAAKLPELKPHDRQAWQLATLHGMTQARVAAELNKEHGKTYTQAQVSRMIARAKAHAEANGLAEKVAGPIDRPRTVDPRRLELGARVDKRRPRPSDMARVDDDDE